MSQCGVQGAVRFEQATAAAVRAIAQRADVAVSFGESSAGDEDCAVQVCLPAGAVHAVARLRGEADSAALRLRHHDAELHRACRPADAAAAMVFDALENARFEALGAQQMPGVAANLAARLDERCLSEGFADAADPEEIPEATAFALLLRLHATDRRWPAAVDAIMRAWMQRIGPQGVAAIQRLARSLGNQRAYADATHRLLANRGFEHTEPRSDTRAPPSQAAESGGAGEAHADENDPHRSGSEAHDAEPAMERSDEAPASAPRPSPMKTEPTCLPARGLDPIAPEGRAEDAGTAAQARAPAHAKSVPDAPPAGDDVGQSEEGARVAHLPRYRVFTAAFDATLTPIELCEPRQLLHWRKCLDDQTAPYRTGVVRLAARLQQQLLARQSEDWDFELEEGLLDTDRLASSIADPHTSAVHKAPRSSDFPDTVLSLLIDNSGSMRGLPIRLAAMCADVVALALERCSVKVEILGYTTREWHGGGSREQWVRSGRPPNPGRLNDLCHIVYKPASTPWRRVRNGIGLLLDEALLKENIDGEAVSWAYRRLLMRPEQRRILLVLSDGAPADASTSSANPADYLDRHLHQVIARIERERAVELAAIGIGHDVLRYYRRAVKLDDPRALGETVLRSLAALLR